MCLYFIVKGVRSFLLELLVLVQSLFVVGLVFGLVLLDVVEDEVVEQDVINLPQVSQLGPAFGALVDEEGVLMEAEFTEGVFAGGGDGVDEVVLAEWAEDGDVGVGLRGVAVRLFLHFAWWGQLLG